MYIFPALFYYAHMNKSLKLPNTYLPVIALFVFICGVCLMLRNWMTANSVSMVVVLCVNLLLFSLAMICTAMHHMAVKNPNPAAFVRSIMGATVLKLFVLTAAVMVYVYITGVKQSAPAIISGMILYAVYTVVEVKGAYKLNKAHKLNKAKDGNR